MLSHDLKMMIKDMVSRYGLRSVVNAVADAAELLDEIREDGEVIADSDVKTAVENLRKDLY